MNEPDRIDPSDLAAIASPAVDPSAESDEFSTAELLDLTPSKRRDYEHLQLVARLDGDKAALANESARLVAEVDRLHRVEIAHAVLIDARKSSRWTTGVSVVAMAVGGALLATPDRCTIQNYLMGLGWGFIAIPGIIQLGKAIFNLR